jgi:hypothetical protein
MFRPFALILFILAAVLAFVSDFTTANISLLFIIGVVAAGLACLAAEPYWKPTP